MRSFGFTPGKRPGSRIGVKRSCPPHKCNWPEKDKGGTREENVYFNKTLILNESCRWELQSMR